MVGRWADGAGVRRAGSRVDRPGIVVSVILLGIVAFAVGGCEKQEKKVEQERAVNVRVWTAESRAISVIAASILGKRNASDRKGARSRSQA